MRKRDFYVYILSSPTATLYTGVTSDLRRRMHEHKHGSIPGFAKRYGVTRLVYYEHTTDPLSAIGREKQIKAWRRAKKVALVESANPSWRDLSPDC